MYFDEEIPYYRLVGTLNPDKTPEIPDLSGLTRLDCKYIGDKLSDVFELKTKKQFFVLTFYIFPNPRLKQYAYGHKIQEKPGYANYSNYIVHIEAIH